MAEMTKTERVMAALRGEDVDRVPVSAWWHDYPREWSPADLAETTLEAYGKFDWDFIKVNPRFSYYAEAWGTTYKRYDDKMPTPESIAVKDASDLGRIKRVDGTSGPFEEQLEALHLIAEGLGGEAPFIQTVFSPLAVMSRITGPTEPVQAMIKDSPARLETALDAIGETLIEYARACIDAGASGVFYAGVEWGSAQFISGQDYDRFCKPYDTRILEAVRDAPFNVLHVCRDNNHLMRSVDYPVAAFNWDTHGEGNPTLADVLNQSDKAVMGGVDHKRTIRRGEPADIGVEAEEALMETRGQRFLLTPNCSIDPTSPEANLLAMVEAVLA
ncbi:MAG TPA: uroporphyrinogen decarboxylase family protein [Dehalococcoidia bacterium]|nr:uroporphyrinogen decarboxylase family protein [Dehalococcoidia bacterium]